MSDDTYTVTFKGGSGHSAPWLVVRADTAEVLHDRITTVVESALFATIGNAAKAMEAAYTVGSTLDAKPVNPPKSKGKAAGGAPATSLEAQRSKAEEAPKEEPPKSDWGIEPAFEEKPKAATGGRPKPAWKR